MSLFGYHCYFGMAGHYAGTKFAKHAANRWIVATPVEWKWVGRLAVRQRPSRSVPDSSHNNGDAVCVKTASGLQNDMEIVAARRLNRNRKSPSHVTRLPNKVRMWLINRWYINEISKINLNKNDVVADVDGDDNWEVSADADRSARRAVALYTYSQSLVSLFTCAGCMTTWPPLAP